MREKRTFIIKTLDLLTIIMLYYIVGTKSIFLYALSFSLYQIFVSFFTNLRLKEILDKYKDNSQKKKIFTYAILFISLISLIFLLLCILISDITSIILNINNSLFVFIMCGISIITKPAICLLKQYMISITSNNKFKILDFVYEVFDKFLLIIVALLCFRAFNLKQEIAVGLLYLSKILSMLIIFILIYILNYSKIKMDKTLTSKINFKHDIKELFTKDAYLNVIEIVKNSYYYISIVIVYLVLSTRYNYLIPEIEANITFIYLYSLSIINYLIYLAKLINETLPIEMSASNRIYQNFKVMLSIAIIFGIISPLTCKVIFNNPNYSIYLVMTNFLAIFILLYDITYENIKNQKIIFISLIIGILSKILLIIPLINAFYRMGYNLIYGDIISSIIGLFLSVIINYIYIKNHEKIKHNYFDKLLDILFDNIILAIILILLEFIIPINTDNYFRALGLIIIYISTSIIYLRLKNIKNKK